MCLDGGFRGWGCVMCVGNSTTTNWEQTVRVIFDTLGFIL